MAFVLGNRNMQLKKGLHKENEVGSYNVKLFDCFQARMSK